MTVTNSIIQSKFRKFLEEFNSRNEIDQSEVAVLQNAYKDTKVKDIPVSWILSADYLLENLYKKHRKPAIALQNSGFFVIQFPNMEPPTPKEFSLIKDFEDEVYAMDADIYKELEVS
jgi:hypothetical protein